MHGVIEHLDEGVHIISAPFCTVLKAIAIGKIRGIVENDLTCCRIGIEIVVDVETIHVVTAHDVGSHIADVTLIFHDARIEEQQSIIAQEAFGILKIGVCGGKFFRTLGFGTERIDPRVQLHATVMTLVDHPREWIPTRILTLTSGEKFAPRFVVALIEGIGFCTHLKHHGIDATGLQNIELAGEIGLHLLATHALELSIDTLNPSTAHLAFRSFKWVLSMHHKLHNEEEEEEERFFH